MRCGRHVEQGAGCMRCMSIRRAEGPSAVGAGRGCRMWTTRGRTRRETPNHARSACFGEYESRIMHGQHVRSLYGAGANPGSRTVGTRGHRCEPRIMHGRWVRGVPSCVSFGFAHRGWQHAEYRPRFRRWQWLRFRRICTSVCRAAKLFRKKVQSRKKRNWDGARRRCERRIAHGRHTCRRETRIAHGG